MRGRFHKSEPTIAEGEDLDVLTFLTKGAKAGVRDERLQSKCAPRTLIKGTLRAVAFFAAAMFTQTFDKNESQPQKSGKRSTDLQQTYQQCIAEPRQLKDPLSGCHVFVLDDSSFSYFRGVHYDGGQGGENAIVWGSLAARRHLPLLQW
jgi:hypothetical protein